MLWEQQLFYDMLGSMVLGRPMLGAYVLSDCGKGNSTLNVRLQKPVVILAKHNMDPSVL